MVKASRPAESQLAASPSTNTEPTETPSSSASGRSESRWARVACASALTSSGVTKVRPFIHAQARDVASSAVAPRGLAPSDSDGADRVARAMSTM